MPKLKLLAAAVFATAVISAPAMAREYHARHRVVVDVAAPSGPDAVYLNGRRCVPAPRVGAFATAPWTNDVPCEPYGYGWYGYDGYNYYGY